MVTTLSGRATGQDRHGLDVIHEACFQTECIMHGALVLRRNVLYTLVAPRSIPALVLSRTIRFEVTRLDL
jgi:hypothetical protein